MAHKASRIQKIKETAGIVQWLSLMQYELPPCWMLENCKGLRVSMTAFLPRIFNGAMS